MEALFCKSMVLSSIGKLVNKSYKPYLDGVRGIAILLVALSHGGYGKIIPGALGVTVFFFISGYLITSLLLKEKEINGEVDLINFYMRRIWRLMPALSIYICISFFLNILFFGGVDFIEPISAILYVSNYYSIYPGYKYINDSYSFYSILWSLAIEEHFYLLFTPLIAFIKSRKKLIIAMCAVLVLPLMDRIIIGYFSTPEFLESYTYYATDTRIDSIAYGSVLAVLGYRKIFNIDARVVFAIGVVGIVVSLLYRDEYFRNTYRYTLQGMSLYLIFHEVIFSEKLKVIREALSNKIIVYVGKLSYSMYLYHWFAVVLMMFFLGAAEVQPVWQMGYWSITIVMSMLSYYLIEKPTLRLRIKYGSSAE
jgi:peptidoglycan/LPS O-acetylase OafA/YrhL